MGGINRFGSGGIRRFQLISVPPIITSPATFDVLEGTTAVGTVTATDGETPYVFSISGGADAALFDIDPDTGVLVFLVAPNYASPDDSGANNVYDITVRATSSGGAYAEQDVAITVTEWTPTQLGTDVKWWMDPSMNLYSDSGTTPAATDGLIYGWVGREAAANRFDQSSSGNRPTLKVGTNSKPFVRFDSGSKQMRKNTPTGLPGGNAVRSFSIGAKITSGKYLFSWGFSGGNLAWSIDANNGSDGRVVGFYNDYTVTGFVIATDAWMVIDGTYDGDTVSLRINGGTPITQATSDFNTDVSSGDYMAQLNQFVAVDSGAVMDMTHLIVTDTVLSTANLNKLKTYLDRRVPT